MWNRHPRFLAPQSTTKSRGLLRRQMEKEIRTKFLSQIKRFRPDSGGSDEKHGWYRKCARAPEKTHSTWRSAEVLLCSRVAGVAAGRGPEAVWRTGQAESESQDRENFRSLRNSNPAPQLHVRELPGNGGRQRKAFTMAKSYAQNFGAGFASFVFSGSPGTGKNHLAAAIGNHLLSGGYSVLVVTTPDLMLRVRECYDEDNYD